MSAPLLTISTVEHTAQVFQRDKSVFTWEITAPTGEVFLSCPVRYASIAHATRDALCVMIGTPNDNIVERLIRECIK